MPRARLAVKRLVLAHVPAHVGDVDAEEEAAIRMALRVDAVIEILRVVAVDGDDGKVPPIAAPAVLLRRWLFFAGVRCLLHVFGERLREVVLSHDGEHVDTGIADLAEHFDDAAFRVAAAVGPLRDGDDDLAARLGAVRFFLRHEDVLRELRIVRRHEAERLAALERADDLLIGTLEDADDLALARASLLLCRMDARDDAVAVHRRRQIRSGHEYVRLFLRLAHVGNDEPESLRRHRELADDEVHAARHAVEVAAVLDDRAVGFECLKRRAEADEVFPFQVHFLREIFREERAIRFLMHICQNPFF